VTVVALVDRAQIQLLAPESMNAPRPWSGLDRLGLTQTLGGMAIGLITLLTSYDHISVFGTRISLQQQWGIPLIAASVATVFVDAQLATRSRLRAAHESSEDRYRADRERDASNRERDRANQERHRANQERYKAAEARERQAESHECLYQAAVLSARVQLEPGAVNRSRLRTFLTLTEGSGGLNSA
jgi:hypothetical protein